MPDTQDAEDDFSISDDDFLLRRIHLNQWEPDLRGGWRPSSGAFSSREGVSVDVQGRLEAPVEEYLARYDEFGVVRVSVRRARHEFLQRIIADPRPENAAHALIHGPRNPRRRLVETVEILQLPRSLRTV